MAGDGDLSGFEGQQRGEDPNEGGFSGAVGAKQAVNRSVRHGQVDALEDVMVAVALV